MWIDEYLSETEADYFFDHSETDNTSETEE